MTIQLQDFLDVLDECERKGEILHEQNLTIRAALLAKLLECSKHQKEQP